MQRLPPGDKGTAAIELTDALPTMRGLFANTSLFTEGEQRLVVAWLLTVAEALRRHPWKVDRPDRAHGWSFEVLRFLPRFDATLVDVQQRNRALTVVHEAYEEYVIDPFADTFTIAATETEGELRAHFGQANASQGVAKRTMHALTQKAAVFVAAGSGLAAAAIYHDTAKAADRLGADLPPDDHRDVPRQLRSQIRHAIASALSSNEFKRVSISVDLRGFNFAGDNADDTATNFVSFVGDWIDTPGTAEGTLEPDDDATSLLDLIPAMTTDGERIVADAATDPQIAVHRDVQCRAHLGALLGDAVRATLLDAVETQGLTADHVVAALPTIPLRDDKRAVLARGIERFLQQDPISAVHILAPTVEGATRRVLEMGGVDATKFRPLGGGAARTDFVTLGALLRRADASEAECVSAVLSEPLRCLLIATTVDQAGPNLRNGGEQGRSRIRGPLQWKHVGQVMHMPSLGCVLALRDRVGARVEKAGRCSAIQQRLELALGVAPSPYQCGVGSLRGVEQCADGERTDLPHAVQHPSCGWCEHRENQHCDQA